MRTIKTVKDLKEYLKDLDEAMPVLGYDGIMTGLTVSLWIWEPEEDENTYPYQDLNTLIIDLDQ